MPNTDREQWNRIDGEFYYSEIEKRPLDGPCWVVRRKSDGEFVRSMGLPISRPGVRELIEQTIEGLDAEAKHHIASTPETGSDGVADRIEKIIGGRDNDEYVSVYVGTLWGLVHSLRRKTTTPTPSPPIPDSTEPSDWKCSDNPNCDGKCCDRADTGGVEGPSVCIEWHLNGTGRAYVAVGDEVFDFDDPDHDDPIINAVQYAFSEGHKAGASGSDGLSAAAKLQELADLARTAWPSETGVSLDAQDHARTKIETILLTTPESEHPAATENANELSDGGMGDE